MLLPLVVAHLALDVATPHESAVALLLHVSHPSLVAPTTAEQSTPIQAMRCPVANAAASAQDAKTGKKKGQLKHVWRPVILHLLFVPLAIVWRLGQID